MLGRARAVTVCAPTTRHSVRGNQNLSRMRRNSGTGAGLTELIVTPRAIPAE